MRTLLKIFIPLAFVILPILLPTNAVYGRGSHFATGIYHKDAWTNVNGLDTLAWGNVRPTKNHRYWAHLVLAILVVVYSCFIFFDELRGYIRLRLAYLTSPQHRLHASATTVLVTAIPKKWRTYEALNGLYNVFPGGIRNIWINRNFDELNDKVKRRDKLARSLESAETALIRNARKAHLKQLQKEVRDELVDKNSIPKKSKTPLFDRKEQKETKYPLACTTDYDPDDGEPIWKRFLEEKDRDITRLPVFGWQWMPSLPLIGRKVDTIDYCRNEVARLNLEIEQDQKEPEKYPLMNSAFIQFNHQVAAHMACQAVSHHIPGQMAPRAVEISPDDVIWDNMSIKWWESYLRTGGVVVAVCGLIILWGIPVTFTGLLSQIHALIQQYQWLAWLGRAPTAVLSILQGILPQALLAALLALLPNVMRFLARAQGGYTGMTVELSVQIYYFAFLFIQVFLVVSLSSGISNIIKKLYTSPSEVPTILADSLPKAANYFFSYLILQALSVSAGALVQIQGLIKWFILAPLLDNTARQKWTRQTELPNMQWGSFFPVYTNLAVIG